VRIPRTVSPVIAGAFAWRDAALVQVPRPAADWVRDPASLTHRLRARGSFSVRPLTQSVRAPRPDEQRLLSQQPRQWALIREVLLHLDGRPVVHARSVLPLASLRGANRRLAHMAQRSLGAELFRAPAARRRAVWLARVPAHTLPAETGTREPVWGRQSLFLKRGAPLLVAEFFLPTLWDSTS
jgi:chorismate--pyruvate lyase